MWSIRVTQYARDFENKAPLGCLQYHFGSDTGVIRSFNWNGGAGRHLSNQNQLICIRREATRLRICYSQEGGNVLNDFLISSGGAAGDVSAQIGILGMSVSTFVAFSISFFQGRQNWQGLVWILLNRNFFLVVHLSDTPRNALGFWICGCRCILESSGSQNSGCT